MTEVKVKEHPMLFSGPMVRAILDGRKTVTRRVVGRRIDPYCPDIATRANAGNLINCRECYMQPGDRIWVKETFAFGEDNNVEPGLYYRATDPGWDDNETGFRWKPSIFMPRHCSRITLGVVSVRAEQVQDIDWMDAIAEGIKDPRNSTRRLNECVPAFQELWDSINGKTFPWESNPWVWRIEFQRIEP